VSLDDFAPLRPHFAPGEVSSPSDDFAPPLTGGQGRRGEVRRGPKESTSPRQNGDASPVASPDNALSENVEAWVDAGHVAAYLGVDREYVYRHAIELGGRKLNAGPKAPWRFKLALVDAALERATCSASRGSEGDVLPMAKPLRRARRLRRMGTGAPLLPVKGAESPSEAA
jgi:hypothetical protein